MIPIFYSPVYVGSRTSFDTTRKAKWVADSLDKRPISGIQLHAPSPVTEEQVAMVHDPDYVHAIITGHPAHLAESQGFDWDVQLWPMVAMSTGGVVAAATAALETGVAGSLSSGLHHARYGSGAGYCTINGLVLAAQTALAGGAQSVLIIDLDAHCGGGTHSLIAGDDRIWQLDISVNSFDKYSSDARMTLDLIENPTDYLPTLEERLRQLSQSGLHFDLCLYNAGMDPDARCSIGGLAGIDASLLARREQTVFDWCRARNLPVAFVLAGGYIGRELDVLSLVELHRLTLMVAAQ
jgi:acetoin utilization deacetylase AcuC-like enzyme